MVIKVNSGASPHSLIDSKQPENTRDSNKTIKTPNDIIFFNCSIILPQITISGHVSFF